MNPAGADVKAIFGKALSAATPAERSAYLSEACGSNVDLRWQVEALLQALDQASELRTRPQTPPTLETSDFRPTGERVDTVVGPYRLLEQIGEGGFGLVYVAEQQAPVRRKVALKILKPGMDTRMVLARFEAERQALALMDHPSIARILDAGTTPTGRPYFVMELVKGVPLTDYCDRNQLTPRERLEQFASVCHAVQHAHQTRRR